LGVDEVVPGPGLLLLTGTLALAAVAIRRE
jgi:hypothetical protein